MLGFSSGQIPTLFTTWRTIQMSFDFSRLSSSETRCPDLVGRPELSYPHLFSSLPDVSSIGRSGGMGMVGDGACCSPESDSLNFQPAATENPEMPQKDMDSDAAKCEVDAQWELNHLTADQTIPDCIVESVMNEDHQGDETPAAFSETIGQRARRERPSRRSCFDNLEPADLVKDADQSDGKVGDKERREEEETQGSEIPRHEGERGIPQMDFTGDWPGEGFLQQRQVRRRGRCKERNGDRPEAASQPNETPNKQHGATITEFQKLLDLIQTGVADIQVDSFTSSSEEELEPHKKEADRCCGSSNSKKREEEDAVKHDQGELPDFVLDQKMSDSCNTTPALTDDWALLKTENEVNIIREANRETGSLALKPERAPNSSPSALSDAPEAHRDGDTELAATLTDVDAGKYTHTSFGADVIPSPVCRSSVGAQSGSCIGGSQERKQRQGRRSGKQCKLALTFTQNCPSSSVDSVGGSTSITSGQHTSSPQVEHLSSDCSTCPEPKSDLSTRSSSTAQPHLPSPPVGVTGCSSQTEPQDFAFLWRLNNQNNLDEDFMSTYIQLHNILVRSGSASRFELSAAVPPCSHRGVPYRVVHDKSTQVADKELGLIQDRLESLRILSRHFKLVSFDTLEDLYNKCHQDLEWTTNLLLDSGEIFFKEEDVDQHSGDGTEDEGNEMKPVVESAACPDVIENHHAEHVGSEDRTLQSAIELVVGSDQSSSSSGGHLSTVMDNGRSETSALLETSQTATNTGGSCLDPEQEVGSEVWGDGLMIEEATVEPEDELANMEAVSALLQAELDRIEKEESEKEPPGRRHMGAGGSQHLDIQSVELKLPTEVALQLVELFGPVGVDPGE